MNKKEGFWYSVREPELPMPVAHEEAESLKENILRGFQLVESDDYTIKFHYRGWSTCRLCGKPNGASEFTANGWTWPQGYRHYVEQHNVRPSEKFKAMLLAALR